MVAVPIFPHFQSIGRGMKIRLSPLAVVLALLVAVDSTIDPASAEDPRREQTRNCLAQITGSRSPEIACDYPAWLTEEERSDMRKLTREMLQDLRCTVAIRIKRILVDDAVELTDHTFQAPPQPVTCDLALKDSTVQITGTFAPRVVIKDGKAVEATPGLADVKGVNSYLAWPVVQYVNYAPGIRKEMLAMINAYLEHLRPRVAGSR